MARCLIVGAGSIGSRRARLLAEMGHGVGIADTSADHRISVTQTLLECGYDVWPETTGPSRYYDAALICTPARDHLRMAGECVEAGIKGLFIEKPLSTSMEGIPELIAECEARGVVTMGACNVRWGYREVPKGPHSEAVLCLSKPLSGWRAGAEAYRDQGVILAAAIHEIDVATMLCGLIVDVYATGYDDAAILMLTHEGDRESRIYASWREGDTQGRWVAVNGDEQRYDADPSDEQYREEMAHFLDHVANGTATTNPIANAAETLGWALKARDMTRAVAAT